jgi:DNA primase
MMEKGKRPDAGNIGPKQELVFNDLITPQILSRAQDKINNSTVFRDTIERIREHNDIVSVISEHVKLKRSGKNYFGLCPFHKEKTPSFSVSPSSQRFKCYGCGESGDIFDFIGAIENLSFLDSLRLLGQRAGISVLISTENEEALKK